MTPLSRQAKRVLRVLRANGPLRQSDVIDATTGDTVWTWKALKALTQRGVIQSATVATGRPGRRPLIYWMEP